MSRLSNTNLQKYIDGLKDPSLAIYWVPFRMTCTGWKFRQVLRFTGLHGHNFSHASKKLSKWHG